MPEAVIPGPARPEVEIREKAAALGFEVAAIARASIPAEARERLDSFLAGGMHGDMGWLAATAERRADPKAQWPKAQSVVVLGLNYGPAGDPRTVLAQPRRGAISVYAQGADYHDVVKKRLKILARWMVERFGGDARVFVDTAAVMEKPLAQAAGIGWQGKHTNLVSREFGSWLFLAAVFTTLDLAPDAPEPDRCGSCRQCLAACPTDAFPAPYRLDARRCISYLTIEHKGHIAREFRPKIGNRIYGCDDCLAVCPWNKFARRSTELSFQARPETTDRPLIELAALDDGAFRALFRGSPVKRIGRERFVRNVLIALGNSGDPSAAAVAETLLDDPSPLVRAMAVWAFRRLADPKAAGKRQARARAAETDAAVRAEWLAQ